MTARRILILSALLTGAAFAAVAYVLHEVDGAFECARDARE